MITPRLNRIAAAGTDGLHSRIHLADGHRIYVNGTIGAIVFEEVALAPGLTAPYTEAWKNAGEPVEHFIIGETVNGGSVFHDVPVDAVRALVQAHGGERDHQDDDLTPVRYQISPSSAVGRYRIDLDGQQIGRIVWMEDGREGYWLATPRGKRRSVEFDDMDEATAHLLQEADIAAGRLTTAAQELRSALTPYGLTLHDIEDVLIGGHVLSWLALGSGDSAQNPDWDQPHLNIYLSDPEDGDEVNIHRPTRENDQWVVELNDGSTDWVEEHYFPILETAAVAAHLAEWHRSTLLTHIA
ncbi:hypothetical protein [Streptomyces sp. NPDC055607]